MCQFPIAVSPKSDRKLNAGRLQLTASGGDPILDESRGVVVEAIAVSMTDLDSALTEIAASRRADPLAPVTVLVPSHVAGLQLRRRLAQMTPFAGVRFETLPRIAELLAAGHLAAQGRRPLARPIGDYIAEQVALESRGGLSTIADLPGYARALREMFRRLRRGGIRGSPDVRARHKRGHMSEVLRVYDSFRRQSERFYDEEDLLDAAAETVERGNSASVADLGRPWVVPPGAFSAGAHGLLNALREAAPHYIEIAEAAEEPVTRCVLAPDPASEAREAARTVLEALEAGIALHEIAVFHGADASYARLLKEAFDSAKIDTVLLPGIPLSETRAGRGVLALAGLPEKSFPRTAVLDFLNIAPLRSSVPGRGGPVRMMAAVWDRISRESGVTRGAEAWSNGLNMRLHDLEMEAADPRSDNEARARRIQFDREETTALSEMIAALIDRLVGLGEPRPAAAFIRDFSSVVRDYFAPGTDGLEEVEKEIAQLGTVDAVGGSFGLSSFLLALRANLEAAYLREQRLGEGVVIGDYRLAGGLQFRQVLLCGAYEGALPAAAGSDPIIEAAAWERLREDHPYVEDRALRAARAEEAARRAMGAAAGGVITWSCPLYEPGGSREYYPSPLMLRAATQHDNRITTASKLRGCPPASWLRRTPSPLATLLSGATVDRREMLLREAVALRRRDRSVDQAHPRHRAVEMLRARRSPVFTAWDGDLSELADDDWLQLHSAVSPTTLEDYAVCGFRYFAKSLLHLRATEEPEERDLMDPLTRGIVIHDVLERFFTEMREQGRPQPYEPWGNGDYARLATLLGEELDGAKQRGKMGRELYGNHEKRAMESDLQRFLDADNEFRSETGAVPFAFECAIPEVEVAGVRLRGRVDRVDMSPDGRKAWVIDYKTGSAEPFKGVKTDPLLGGSKLQLPSYLLAAQDAEEARALYWFITQREGFQRIDYEDSAQNRAVFERTLNALVRGIRSGAFPAVSGDENEYYGRFEHCRYCDFDRACSLRRDQEFEAKSGDEKVAAWLAVSLAAKPEGQT